MTANLMHELINEIASCLLPEANATSGRMTCLSWDRMTWGMHVLNRMQFSLSCNKLFFMLCLKGQQPEEKRKLCTLIKT